jgi:polyvinyl alcohol dehydrogenase (cytochrome)
MISHMSAFLRTFLLAAFSAAALNAAPASAQAIQALGLFEQRCGVCHTKPTDGRTPDRDSLRQRTPEAVLEALTNGSMKVNAEGLSVTAKKMLAEYITERPIGAALAGQASAMPNRCAVKPLGNPLAGPAWNGWGADAGNTRYQPAAAAGITAAQVPSLTLRWAFGFPNGTSAYGQPTVAGGRVFVGSDNGFVYSLDAASGCVYWSFQAKGGVRTAISIGSIGSIGSRGSRGSIGSIGSRYAAYFGDVKANVYAIDAESGTLLWTKSAESHPLARITGAPALFNGRLYVPVASFEEGSWNKPN